MAEKVIRNNQRLVPFFGERLSFIRGLDPLGLQNTSDSTFSMLLPGLNNVTGRIRYYSFYCWLLDEYSKRNGSTNPEEQKGFIRRAEYIIALSSQYYDGDASGVPGSNYASKEINVHNITNHNLQGGTFKPDGSTAETYWNYSFGAFGQYYLGSLRDIGVVNNREQVGNIYVRTNSISENVISGESLANAFDENITSPIKKLFFDCIETGFVNDIQLKSILTELNLTHVPSNTSEHDLLVKLLLQKDYPLRIEEEPSTFRNQTLGHLLKFLSTEVENFYDRIFVYHAYNEKGLIDGEKNYSLTGWYYYQFNEFWHFSNTSIFSGTLSHLESIAGPNWLLLSNLLTEVTDEIIKEFIEQGLLEDGNSSLKNLLETLDPNEYNFLNSASEANGIKKASSAFLLMFSQYLNNKDELISLKEYSENNDLGKDGEGSTYFLTQFANKLSQDAHQFIFEYLYKNIIYRHQYIAFRKIRGGSQSTQKFIIEDQHIRYLGNFEAGYTGPRLGRLIGFISDLGIIDSDNRLTKQGVSLIESNYTTHD